MPAVRPRRRPRMRAPSRIALTAAIGVALSAFAAGRAVAGPDGANGTSSESDGPDAEARQELESLKRRLEDQKRRVAQVEGSALSDDEIAAAVSAYSARDTVATTFVGGADGGKAGWPLGKRAFIAEGPNR